MQGARWPVLAALLTIAALALGYTYWLATGFDMSAMMSPVFVPWSMGYFLFMLMMWVVMMIGMMTPTVAPTVLLYAAFSRRQSPRSLPSAGWFAAGYLVAWSAFALAATLLQWLLEWRALVTPMMAGTSRTLGGAMLIAAGLYQWLPAKQTCLTQCRAPLSFIQKQGGFPHDARGALRLGWRHGLYCVGCCWAVMALLFVFGVMNLRWIAGLMIFVLLEKLLPWPGVFSRLAGVIAVAAGVWMMISAG